MNIGIVGHEAAKFTPETEATAKAIIRSLLSEPLSVCVSGHCHLGGVDIWAEEIADELGRPKIIHVPKTLQWEGGFKQRNLAIAKDSDEVHCIVVTTLPDTYAGMRFNSCYHCRTGDHVKSGGCWTAKRSRCGVWHKVSG